MKSLVTVSSDCWSNAVSVYTATCLFVILAANILQNYNSPTLNQQWHTPNCATCPNVQHMTAYSLSDDDSIKQQI